MSLVTTHTTTLNLEITSLQNKLKCIYITLVVSTEMSCSTTHVVNFKLEFTL